MYLHSGQRQGGRQWGVALRVAHNYQTKKKNKKKISSVLVTFCALFLQVKIYVCVQKCEQPKPVYTKSRATFHLASWPIHSFIKIAAATSTSHRHCSQDLFIWRQARKRSQQHNGNQVAAATSEVATTANCSSSNMFIARHIVGNILRLSYFFLAKATITMARKPQQKKATNNYATLLLNE